MRKLKFLLAGIVILGTLSCSDDDKSSNNANGNINEIINTAKSGTWRITNFEEDTNIETQNFTGYNFTFGNNGVLTAVNGATTYTGTWSVSNSSNSNDDDGSSSDIDFNIGFTSPTEFVDLTDDWDVIERTANKIRLIDVSGGNGGTDYLTFEKN